MTSSRPAAVIVLAAGEGTRMKSATPKVLHTLGGRTMLGHVLAAAEQLDPEHLVVVVGHGRDQVTASLSGKARAVVQETQDGTGHAVQIALDALGELDGPIVVVPGDTPLLSGSTLQALLDEHVASGAATTLLTARVIDPTGYGRVVRDEHGVAAVVEHKDADEATRAIDEVNTSVYAFSASALRSSLTKLDKDNAQGELYLTDVVGLHRAEGLPVAARIADDPDETLGCNDRAQLADLARKLRDRINLGHMRAGVAILDPATTWIDSDVVIEPDVTIERNTALRGSTVVRRDAVVGPDSTVVDCEVGEGASLVRTQATGAVLGRGATVGPFSFLRPGTVLGEGAKVGAFVEVKASEIGDGSKVPHLSYVGDTTIGRGSNVGAGTIVANYDGQNKHRTVIGDDVRIGSNNTLVAPLHVGDGAYTGAGTAVTDDVPDDALAVRGGKQRNIEGRGASARHKKGDV